jgi:hypothetical protein
LAMPATLSSSPLVSPFCLLLLFAPFVIATHLPAQAGPFFFVLMPL